MNILLCSVPFRPSVGGIETVSALLAEEFRRLGHAVTVVTQTRAEGPDPDPAPEPYAVVRRPGPARLFELVRQADVVLHAQISLRLAWPLLLLRRPWVVAHHTWIPRAGAGRWAGLVKFAVLRLARNVAVSRAVAATLPVHCPVIPNPYAHALFRHIGGIPRQRDLVFLGRLVSDKGVGLLLQALATLRERGLAPSVSIIGQGPEEARLRAQARQLGITGQVAFTGRLAGEELVRTLNAHRIVVVPSVWEEPFGLVALEALACGCIPLVAASGGLPEAAGPAGVVFARGDSAALAERLAALLARPAQAGPPDPAVLRHLEQHQPERVAAAYLCLLGDALGKHRSLAHAS